MLQSIISVLRRYNNSIYIFNSRKIVSIECQKYQIEWAKFRLNKENETQNHHNQLTSCGFSIKFKHLINYQLFVDITIMGRKKIQISRITDERNRQVSKIMCIPLPLGARNSIIMRHSIVGNYQCILLLAPFQMEWARDCRESIEDRSSNLIISWFIECDNDILCAQFHFGSYFRFFLTILIVVLFI